MNVCTSDYVYHYLLNSSDQHVDKILEEGLRPLSDFPDSDRWKQLQEYMPGFYENLYKMLGEPILNKPYHNSGVFVTIIDFYKMPEQGLSKRPRFKIPVSRLDPEWSVLTYVREEDRKALPFNPENLQKAVDLWTADEVNEWFGKDNTKVFFYVPQIAAYQPGGIPVTKADLQQPD